MLLSILAVALLVAADKEPKAPSEGLDASYQNLKNAEEQKDSGLILKWAVETVRAAREVIKAPEQEPGALNDPESRKARLEFARTAKVHGEYALCTAALAEKDRQKMMALFETLERESPDSQYLPQLYSPYMSALTQGGKPDQAYAFAAKSIGKSPSNEDLLLILADGAMTRKQFDKAAGFGTRLASVMTSKAKPETVAASDWERKRSLMLGRGYYIAGLSYANISNHMRADKNLRAALPYIKGEPALAAPAYFFLGVANYNVARATLDQARMKEAIRFSEQAVAIPGPYQEQAQKNVWAMQQDLARLSGARR